MLGEAFERALVFANRLHQNQRRKGSNVPYITHLLAVTSLVGEAGGEETMMIAALLHDAIEDQGGRQTAALIQEMFGTPVLYLVEECSDSVGDPKPPWRARKEAYIARLPNLSPRAKIITIADKLHNARCLEMDILQDGLRAFEKFNGGMSGTIWYLTGCANILAAENTPQTRELLACVTNIAKAAETPLK